MPNIPILDDEYFRRRAQEQEHKRQVEYWRDRSSYLSYSLRDTTEEEDKELFMLDKITEEELRRRTARRWKVERANEIASRPADLIKIEKTRRPTARTALLMVSAANIVPFLIGVFIGTPGVWIPALALGLLALSFVIVPF